METHKVKEEVMEQDTDQMTVYQFYLSRRNTSASDAPHMIKQRKPLETKKKHDWTMKRPSSLTHKTKQLISHDMEKSAGYKRRRVLADQFYDHLEADSPVMKRAKEIKANLAPEFPSFIKTMLPSHVTRVFWMALSMEFCHLHLPRHDTTVHLIDESGEKYKVNYPVTREGARCALSGGWRKFSTANKLLEGDVLIFQLVKPSSSKFKVYIVRANGAAEVDGALGLLNLDARAKQVNSKERIARPLSMNVAQENIQQNNPMALKSNLADQSEIDSEGVGSGTFGYLVDFKKVGSIKNFIISVNGSTINSQLSEYHITKYYELCCTQNSFLHNHLHKTINCKLAAEIISHTINIADAIRACHLSTSQDDYSTWDGTLECFELFGMNVQFLRAKISRLLSLAFESKEAVNSKRFKEARIQRSCAEGEIRTLELKRLELKNAVKKLDFEMETLKVNAEKFEVMFQKEVNAPW